MPFRCFLAIGLIVAGVGVRIAYRASAAGAQDGDLELRFASKVQPFLQSYCHACHGGAKPKAMLDLTRELSVSGFVKHIEQWQGVLERLEAGDMPPDGAKKQPSTDERAAIIAFLRELRDREADRSAGDPGTVLARRLSNAEYDYTIRDLTGVDIRPTKEFPVDPANQAGFDNTGESLTMSPALLKKYLAAARHVAEHVVFKPHGFDFAPHPMVAETDRDKYCVQRILDFYQRHAVDLADYFQAARRYHDRQKLDRPNATLDDFAAESKLNAGYLKKIAALYSAKAPPDFAAQRDAVVNVRKQLKVEVKKLGVSGISIGSQPLILWRNAQFAGNHRRYAGNPAADMKKLKDAGITSFLGIDSANERESLEAFCDLFPDTFVVIDRGPYFDQKQAGKGRPLTAGFHLMQGYFRDDRPLCDLILTAAERHEIDILWHELDFIALAPMRQYADFIFFERAEPPRFLFEAEFDFARSEDKDCHSAAKMTKLAKMYLDKAIRRGAQGDAVDAIASYFNNMSALIRKIEAERLRAEPSHLESLLKFAERAYRRPLSKLERDDLLAFYRQIRKQDDPGHEEAMRDVIASVLMSPHFCFRFVKNETKTTALNDYELASRLSYFLWSSMPDAELLSHAANGDLHEPDVLLGQTRRMLRDPKVRGLAVEFAGNWLDIRRFEEHNAVDRGRFQSFTNELRQAMYEEPIRYFVDVARHDRSVLDFLYGQDTFVNAALAAHYGIPFSRSPKAKTAGPIDEWIQVKDADRYGRGGLLPMAVFLTKNAPGLRTSPVKRGYWVVRRVLGETIPPPPPTVPELPADEAKTGDLSLPQLLARHRKDAACSGCHKRFDSVGVVFEGFGPIGERRAKDLAGRPVELVATFPDGRERAGIDGLKAYLKEKRQDDYVDNFCKKMFSYALGRGLQLSDRQAIAAMKGKLAREGYRFGSAVETIVSSKQFLQKRGAVE